MYYSAFDEEKALLVCRLASGGDEANDFGPHLERLDTASLAVQGKEFRLALLIIIDSGHPLPNSSWRKRIAETTGKATFKPYFAVVTDNPLVRGMLTALSWLRPQMFEAEVGPSIDRAIAWLEAKRGQPLRADLGQMIDQVTKPAGEQAALR